MLPARGRLPRVLEVAPRFPPFSGGVEMHVAEVAPRLARAGFDVRILTTDVSGELPPEDEHLGVPVTRVRAYPASRDYYWAPAIYAAVSRGDPWDLVHVHSYQTFVAPTAMLAARRAGIPYVLTFHSGGHSSRLRNAIRGIQRGLLRPLLMGAARLVAVSQFEIDFFSAKLRIPMDRFVLIPNGGQLPDVAGLAAAEPRAPLIVSVGRLERYKGHHRMIRAMPAVLRRAPRARLRIAGGGPYAGELRRLADALGVGHRVEIGPIPLDRRDEMASLLASASVVTLLSEYEAQAISVVEALALRRPTVVAYAAGLMEFVDRGLARGVRVHAAPHEVADAVLAQLSAPLSPSPIAMPSWDRCALELGDLYLDSFAAPQADRLSVPA